MNYINVLVNQLTIYVLSLLCLSESLKDVSKRQLNYSIFN
jgi:hypothetical protein